MVLSVATSEGRRQALRGLSNGLLRGAGAEGSAVRGHLLEIRHAVAPHIESEVLQSQTGRFGLTVTLDQDGWPGSGAAVRCATSELPFQDQVFDLVFLNHVIASGDEPELAEAARVLSRNGVLLLLGLNRLGWRYRAQGAYQRLPGLAPFRVRTRLERAGLEVYACAGAGLVGRSRPAFLQSGLAGLVAPMADVVLLQARHRPAAGATPLRFRKQRAPVVQSAALHG